MSAIVLLTGNHLCHNPRVIKSAAALARAGHEVEVLGAWWERELKDRDLRLARDLPFRFTPVLDHASSSGRPAPGALLARLRAKAGQWAFLASGRPNRWQLGPTLGAMGRAARRRRADLFIAHSEAGMAAAADLLKDGRRVGVDMEDWFSEDLSAAERQGRPFALLRALEETLLRRGAWSACPSAAMSEALVRAFGCPAPSVIYNAFPWVERSAIDGAASDRRGSSLRTIYWFSQSIGPGRGLEDLFAALPMLAEPAEVHLRGRPVAGFDAWLGRSLPEAWRERVKVHAVVPNGELLSRISEHDIGFAGELVGRVNSALTVSNKMLHCLLGGLPVVASDTPGQREVAARAPEAVSLYPSGDPRALAVRLNRWLSAPAALENAKSAAARSAEASFCWERQEPVLLESVRRALSATPARAEAVRA